MNQSGNTSLKNTTHSSAEEEFFANTINNFVTSWSACIIPVTAVLAMILNVLTIVVLNRFCGKLSNHLILVLTQCTADLTFAIVNILPPTSYFFPLFTDAENYMHFQTVCGVMQVFSQEVMICNQIIITLEHFIAIHKPLQYHQILTRRTIISLIGCYYITVFLYHVLVIIVSYFLCVSVDIEGSMADMICLHYHVMYYTVAQNAV